MIAPLLLRAACRYHVRHPLQLLLAVLGVSLGVAVVVAVDVANAGARRAFLLSAETLAGRATHEVIGGPGGLPDSLYTVVRTTARIDSAAPVIDRYVRLVNASGATRTVRLLGVDPFAEAPFRPYLGPAAPQVDVGALVVRRALVVGAATAAGLGLAAGDSVTVRAGTSAVAAVIAGTVDDDDAGGRIPADVVLADIATAQELTGAAGVLDRIELRVAGPGAGERLRVLAAALPPGPRLLDAGTRAGATVRLTRAFETSLLALALVALVFGVFLIYNSITFSLVQRRPLLGLLRAQGVTAREVLVLVLLEAAVIGAAASAAGIIGGSLLGGWLTGLVARTVNDLYYTVTAAAARVDAATIVKAMLLGVVATIIAALPPALEAVRARPREALARSTLERARRAAVARLALAGTAAAAAAAALLVLPSRSLLLGFAALFVLVLAAALLTPAATVALMAAVRPLLAAAGPITRMAGRAVTASLSRTTPAVAALSVALAVGIAVTVLIASFRGSVIAWLEQSLQADVYISTPDIAADRAAAGLDTAFIAAVAALPGTDAINTYRHTPLLLDDDFVRLSAVQLDERQRRGFALLDGRPADVWPAFAAGDVLISEAVANRRGVRAGSVLQVPTDRGTVGLRVAGVFRDYASEHGVIFIDRREYRRLWDDDAITSIAVFLRAGTAPDAWLASLRDVPGADAAVVRSNRALREATLVVFDRTFVITGVLRILSLLVAFVGVTGALMALQLERVREIGVLRATGMTPMQVLGMVASQTALMGFTAAVLAAPLGVAMAWAMVHVINRRAFGWSFELTLGATPFAQALFVGVAAALLAGLHPAWRMARTRPALAVREE